jgi:hypothetical protein
VDERVGDGGGFVAVAVGGKDVAEGIGELVAVGGKAVAEGIGELVAVGDGAGV